HSRSVRVRLMTTAAIALAMAAPAAACPLGSHDSPRVQLLHGLTHATHPAATSRVKTAQAQHQVHPQSPAHTELGTYSRELPKGAAAARMKETPPLYENLGQLSWAAARPSGAEARAYFDQGYRLAWAFNHGEAARAFRAAQALDPSCVMCL